MANFQFQNSGKHMIQETIIPSISADDYDIVFGFASNRVSDPALINELVGAYIEIAKQLNISPAEFVIKVKNQGSDFAQDVYLTYYMNSIRVKNAMFGVMAVQMPVESIAREIRA